MSLIKITDEQTKKCEVALNENPDAKAIAYYKSIGFKEGEFEVGYNGIPYLKGYAPQKPQEVKEQEVRAVRNQYIKQYVDDRAKSPFMWDEVPEEEKELIGAYRKYLVDYTETEGWYEQNPMTFEEWRGK